MDRLLIQRRATQIREQLGVDHNSPIDLFSLTSSDEELTLVVYPFREEISGMCVKSAKLIAVNSNSTYGRKRFSLAHELYHYYFDENNTSVSCFKLDNHSSAFEKQANLFASYLLMPDAIFSTMCDKTTENKKLRMDVVNIMELEQFFRVSRKAVLIRLYEEKYISKDEELKFSKNIISTARKNGFDTTLYSRSKNNSTKTYGSYLKKALTLKDGGAISKGKYEEYLFEANRADIVFDENGDDEIYD